jgi:threonine dehydratase
VAETIVKALPALDFEAARQRLSPVVSHTPLMWNQNLSRRYQANIFLKREDLQVVRSYKIRGAFNLMSSLPAKTLQ